MTEDEYSDAVSQRLKRHDRAYEHAERAHFIIQILTAIAGVYLTIRYLV